MGELAVTVRLHGQVVEDQVVTVRRVVRLGEAPTARVCFPGADLTVVRVEQGLLVRGRCLVEGEEMQLALGPVEVALAHTVPVPFPQPSNMDMRFLLSALLVAAMGVWLDAASAWIARQRNSEGESALVVALERVVRGAPTSSESAAASSRTR